MNELTGKRTEIVSEKIGPELFEMLAVVVLCNTDSILLKSIEDTAAEWAKCPDEECKDLVIKGFVQGLDTVGLTSARVRQRLLALVTTPDQKELLKALRSAAGTNAFFLKGVYRDPPHFAVAEARVLCGTLKALDATLTGLPPLRCL